MIYKTQLSKHDPICVFYINLLHANMASPFPRFHDKLQINFLESQVRHIPLSSYGQGTTITSDPPLTPHLDLGPNFR